MKILLCFLFYIIQQPLHQTRIHTLNHEKFNLLIRLSRKMDNEINDESRIMNLDKIILMIINDLY